MAQTHTSTDIKSYRSSKLISVMTNFAESDIDELLLLSSGEECETVLLKSCLSSDDSRYSEQKSADEFSPCAMKAKKKDLVLDYPKNAMRRMRRPLRKLKCIDDSSPNEV